MIFHFKKQQETDGKYIKSKEVILSSEVKVNPYDSFKKASSSKIQDDTCIKKQKESPPPRNGIGMAGRRE